MAIRKHYKVTLEITSLTGLLSFRLKGGRVTADLSVDGKFEGGNGNYLASGEITGIYDNRNRNLLEDYPDADVETQGKPFVLNDYRVDHNVNTEDVSASLTCTITEDWKDIQNIKISADPKNPTVRFFLAQVEAEGSGVYTGEEEIPDAPEAPPIGEIPVDLERVFEGPTDTYKMVGMLGTPEGLVVTCSNVFRGGNRSKVFLNGNQIYQGNEETVGQPFFHGQAVYFPVEHGDHTYVMQQGQTSLTKAARTKGRWSVAGISYGFSPLLSFNNKYHHRQFDDHPILQDAITGEIKYTLNAESMVRKFTVHEGELWACCAYGESVIINTDGEKYPTPTIMIESFNGTLYGGGGSLWGPTGDPANADGNIYRWTGSQMEPIFDTGCSSIQFMSVMEGNLYLGGIDPDRLYVMDPSGAINLIAEVKGETAHDRARSFGVAAAIYDGHIYFGRSSKDRAYVYKLVPRFQPEPGPQPPDGGGGDDDLPFNLDDVHWHDADVSGWRQSATLESVSFSGSSIRMPYDKADHWRHGDINGTVVNANPWVIAKVGSEWHAATWEWLRPGQTTKTKSKVFGSHVGGPAGDVNPRSGDVFGFMVTTLARGGKRTTNERSNIVMATWP